MPNIDNIRDKNDQELLEEIQGMYEGAITPLISGFEDNEVPYPEGFDDELNKLLEYRDKEYKTIDDEEDALNAMGEESVRDDK